MTRGIALVLVGGLVLLSAAPATSSSPVSAAPSGPLRAQGTTSCGGTLTHGQKDPVRSLDSSNPGGTLTAQEIFRHIYDGLVIFDEKLEPHPNLAQSWTVSADGREWTFRLRRGVKFQDGTAFNSAAARYHSLPSPCAGCQPAEPARGGT